MHADYLEIRKNFLSHAAPKRSMAGMPSDIRTAGPKGMRQKSIDKEAKNNPALRVAKRTYASMIDVAKRYNSGKISLDQAESLYRGLQNSFDSGFYKNSEMSQDTASSAFLSGNVSSETEGMKNLGFSDSDIREVFAFMKAVGNGGYWIRGSKAGMPSNIKHSAMKKSMAGMPSDIRTAGPKGMRQRANEKMVNHTPGLSRIAKAFRAALDVAKRYKSGKISYDQAKSLAKGLEPIMSSSVDVSQATIDNFDNNIKSERELIRAMGINDDDWTLLSWFMAKMNNPNTNVSRGSKAGMPSNIRK